MGIKHCCERMDFFLKEAKVDIFYYKIWREYAIGMKNGTSAVQIIYFCPWCSAKLAENLSDRWFEILKDEYNIEYPFEDKVKAPTEFWTDEWWKKRGL